MSNQTSSKKNKDSRSFKKLNSASSSSTEFEHQRNYGQNNPTISVNQDGAARANAQPPNSQTADSISSSCNLQNNEQLIVVHQATTESSQMMSQSAEKTPSMKQMAAEQAQHASGASNNPELMHPRHLQQSLNEIEERNSDLEGSQGTSRASRRNQSQSSMSSRRNHKKRRGNRLTDTISRNQEYSSSQSSSSRQSEKFKKTKQDAGNLSPTNTSLSQSTRNKLREHQNGEDGEFSQHMGSQVNHSSKFRGSRSPKITKNKSQQPEHLPNQEQKIGQTLVKQSGQSLSMIDQVSSNYTVIASNIPIEQSQHSIQYCVSQHEHMSGLGLRNQGSSSGLDMQAKPSNMKKNRFNKAGTMHMDENKYWSKNNDLKKVNSAVPWGGSQPKGGIKSAHFTKSVSHACSPIFLNESNTAQVTDFKNNNNDPLAKLMGDELLNFQIMDALDAPQQPIDRKKVLIDQIKRFNCSIEGDISDVSLSEAKNVRDYIGRNIEHAKENSWKTYNEREVKEFKSVKSILSRRTQFNDNKQEFHNQLKKKFPLGDQNQLSILAKDVQEKTKKRAQSNQLGSSLDKKNQESVNCYQRCEKNYMEMLYMVKDEFSFFVHGRKYKFSKNSLGFLSNKSRFRILLVWIVTSPWFDKIILILIIGNSICLGAKDYLDPENLTDWNKNIDMLDPYFTVAFCVECVLKILAMGFFMGKGAYLKDVWNWLDFIVVVSSVLEIWFPSLTSLKIFKLFRPLRSLNNVKSMKVLVDTLFKSMMSLSGIMGLAIFFFTIFAILGISQWRGLSHFRCRATEFPVDGDWLTVEGDTQPCQAGIRECPIGYCGSLLEYDNQNPGTLYAVDDLYRDSNILELNYGVTNFDHLGSAFITIFQCITMEGWTTVMYIYQDLAAGYIVVSYFMSCVVICSFFLLNLTIAVMLMQYDEIDQKNNNSPQKIELKKIGFEGRIPAPLVDFIIKEANITIGEEALKEQRALKQGDMTLCQKLLATEYVRMPDRTGYYSQVVPRFFFAIAKSNIFGIIIMVCIILNTMVLSMDRFPEADDTEKLVLSYFNMVFNVVFTAEVVIKLVGLGLNRYFKSVENIFDFLVVGMSWMELGLGSEGGSSLGALRAVRLFRVFKLMKSGNLRILMDSILFTISTIGPYTVLLCLFLYVFALAGMNFFAGNFRFLDQGIGVFDKENGVAPRHNFDTLPDALLTTFGCFIGDNWTLVMYDAMRSSGGIYSLYFVGVIAFGNIVMLNLFLAILLGNFDRARDFGGKKKLIECFLELRDINGRDFSQCIDMILTEQQDYIKFTILRWNRRIVKLEQEQGQSSPFMRQMLPNYATFMEKMDYSFVRVLNLPSEESEDDDDEQSVEDVSKSSRRRRFSRHTMAAANRPDINIVPLRQASVSGGSTIGGGEPQSAQERERKTSMLVPKGSDGGFTMAVTKQQHSATTFHQQKSSLPELAHLNSSDEKDSDLYSIPNKPSIGVGRLTVKSQHSASEHHNKFDLMPPAPKIMDEIQETSRENKSRDNRTPNRREELDNSKEYMEQNSQRSMDPFNESQKIPMIGLLERSESAIDASKNSISENMGGPSLEVKQSEAKIERYHTQKEKKIDHRFNDSQSDDSEWAKSPRQAAEIIRQEGADQHQLNILAVATMAQPDGEIIEEKKEFDNNQSELLIPQPIPQSHKDALDSPSDKAKDSKRRSFSQSIKSFFTSSTTKQKQAKELEEAQKEQQKKYLRPYNQHFIHSKETMNLEKLIEESNQYVIGENKQYYLHEIEAMKESETVSKAGSMISKGRAGSMIMQTPGSPSHNNLTSALGQSPSNQIVPQLSISPDQRRPSCPNSARYSGRELVSHNMQSGTDRSYNQKFATPIVDKSSHNALSFGNSAVGKSFRRKSMAQQSVLMKRKPSLFIKSNNFDKRSSQAGVSPSTIYNHEQPKASCCRKCCSLSCWVKVKNHFKNSSLLLFHRDSRIRQFCLQFLKAPPAQKNRDDDDGDDNFGKIDVKQSSMLRSENNKDQKLGSNQYQSRNPLQVDTRRQLMKCQTQDQATSSSKRRSNVKPGSSYSRRNTRKGRDRRNTSIFSKIDANQSQKQPKKGKCAQFCQKRCTYFYNSTPNKWFDNTILLLIFTSSVMLTLDSPLVDPNSTEAMVYGYIDMVHTVLFTIEMLVKMIGLGFFTNEFNDPELTPYIKTTWNVLDFFVVISSLFELIMPLFAGEGGGSEQFKAFKALRALRALRPLRMVSKNEGMKIVVKALMTSLPGLTNVIVVCMLLLLILAIVGVNLFKGKYFSCQGLDYDTLQKVDNNLDCIELGGTWENQHINFDNVANAISSLFQMMTTEGWQGVMYNGMDARGVDLQPKKNAQPALALYFVAYMIIGSQFIINLFVGVVIDNFNKIKYNEEMGNSFVTHEQKQWIEIQKICLRKNLVKALAQPKGYQILFNTITENAYFDYTITFCICLNTISMAMVHYLQSDEFTFALEILNYIFAFIFNVEMILKLLAQGRNYFRQGWNVFDCFIVFGTDFGLIVKFAGLGESMGSTTQIIRGFRIMRIFRLIKASISIRLLIDTIMNILPQITNIMSLMGILLFIYAALGLNLFSQVMFQDQLNEKNNFRNFGNAMILLMRCTTGEDWNLVMYELANTEGYDGEVCREQTFEEQQLEGIQGCGSMVSFIYFFSFVILITMLILNLSVAAVIQGLDAACQENLGFVSSDDVIEFIRLWKYYDPNAKGWIGAEALVYLLIELPAPLGRKKEERPQGDDEQDVNGYSADRFFVHKDKKIVIKKIKALAMLQDNLNLKMFKDPNYVGGYKVHYQDVLRGLLKRILNEKKQDFKVRGAVEKKIAGMWSKKHKDLKHNTEFKAQFKDKDKHETKKLTAADLAAVRIIENWFVKKKQLQGNKPETKKVVNEELEQFKAVQQRLARARNGIPEQKEEIKHKSGANTERPQSSRRNQKSAAEQNKKKDTKTYEEEEVIRGGKLVWNIIQSIDTQRRKASKASGGTQKLEDVSPRLKQIRTGSLAIRAKQSKSNMVGDDVLTWNNKDMASRLLKEVEAEEQKRQKLPELYLHEQLESDSESRGSMSMSHADDSRRSRTQRSQDTVAPQKAANDEQNASQVDEGIADFPIVGELVSEKSASLLKINQKSTSQMSGGLPYSNMKLLANDTLKVDSQPEQRRQASQQALPIQGETLMQTKKEEDKQQSDFSSSSSSEDYSPEKNQDEEEKIGAGLTGGKRPQNLMLQKHGLDVKSRDVKIIQMQDQDSRSASKMSSATPNFHH